MIQLNPINVFPFSGINCILRIARTLLKKFKNLLDWSEKQKLTLFVKRRSYLVSKTEKIYLL
jgi:hypothetical protein